MSAWPQESEPIYRPRIVPLEPRRASGRRVSSRWLLAGLLLVVALFLWVGHRLLLVPVATTVSGSGWVEPALSHTVRAAVQGQLSAVMVSVGDTVSRGQVLARFDDRHLQDQLLDTDHQLAGLRLQQRHDDETRAAERRKIAVDRHTAELDLVDARDHLRVQSLDFLGHIVDTDSVLAHYAPGTNVSMDAAVNGVLRVRDQLASLDVQERNLAAERLDSLQTVQKILQLEGDRAATEHQLAESVVRAPIAGVIQTADLRDLAGRAFNPGDALLDVADPSSWVARLFVSGTDVSRVRVGDTVRITIEPLVGLLDRPLTATVRRVGVRPTMQQGYQGLFPVSAAIFSLSPAAARAIRSGLPAKAAVVTARLKGLTVIRMWIRRKLSGHGSGR